MATVDFAPTLRRRIAALPVSGAESAEDRDVDLLRLDLAARQLTARRGDSVLMPVCWSSLAGTDRGRLMSERFARLEPTARSRLKLAISGAPPFATPKQWSDVVGPLGRQLGEVGLMIALTEGDLVSASEAIVADWPLALLVIDGAARGSLPPIAHHGVITAARSREIPVLVRMADAADLRAWHELGATLFTEPG